MRFISRKFHAVLDYMTGILLIAAPWLFNFADVESAKWVAIASSIILLVLSFLTDYEGGGKKSVSMSGHLTMDVILGIFLAASPWIFNFDEYVYLPHLIVGILEVGAGLLTERTSEHSHKHHIDGNISHAH
ncbi:SPW repeat domain-containing protein [Desertivirga brevis]|uniref:SPW repeat domain-containing protein n=1 Tax=Desertivirga brevis TaxID=2810310 RepID=UPI001A97CC07|nr:SPW repeat protein [Pedobacter sp. SYSU D00873]